MASVIPELEYDLFISYRHNDNAFDGWVTEFINKLKLELQATIKDTLSIYFDENHEDGLLEYQQVDKSLENKLKSAIFIPIISRTYCDVEKYAWKYEFLKFKELAKGDKYGLNILLANRNVASRILPVKIHQLDMEDTHLLEDVLEGNLRSIDFIYEGMDGVNRPLRSRDDDISGRRYQMVLYRNQINKTANAVSEIIKGLKYKSIGKIPVALSSEVSSHKIAVPFESPGFSPVTPYQTGNIYVSENPYQKPVFICWSAFDIKARRDELMAIMQKAGLNVTPLIDCPSDEEAFKRKVSENLELTSFTVHMFGNEFGRRFEAEDQLSFPMYQYEEARKMLQSGKDNFKMYIWHLPNQELAVKPVQTEFINHVRNSIIPGIFFTNVPGPMQLVDDIRSMFQPKAVPVATANDTEIFFINNQLDESDAVLITDELCKHQAVETLTIIQDQQDHYREKSAIQIKHSRLAVVYFKEASDWGISYVKQIWKLVGGASSKTPILLIGEDDPPSNQYRIFKAPKVISLIVSKAKIVEEILRVHTSLGNPAG